MTLTVEGVTTLLEIFDMPTSVAFYRDKLGFEVIATSKTEDDDYTWALLKLNDAYLMFNTAYDVGERPPRPDPARVRHHADTALFFGCRDLEGAYGSLRAKGIEIAPPVVQAYGMRQLWLKDPDGFNLCFQWPAGSETHAGR